MFSKMILLCALFIMVAASTAAADRRHLGRIIGGEVGTIEDFPYQLSMEERDRHFWDHVCGASIISESAALTAAHCVVDDLPNQIRLRSGSDQREQGGELHYVESIIVHPEYDGLDFDYAVLIVREPFTESETTQIIELADAEPSEDEEAVVSGWGDTDYDGDELPEELMFVHVPIVNRDLCNDQYDGDITENMICAGVPEGGKDSCQGDSGGPLVIDGVQVGVVSFGDGCGLPDTSGVYSNVANMKSWILEEAAKGAARR